jgi:sec-independent protein translocase protein TatA
MFGNLRGSEWLILILVIVLLFGARRLPDAARGLGRSLRIFKAETKGLTEPDATASASEGQAPPKAVDAASAPEADPAPATAEPNKPTQT